MNRGLPVSHSGKVVRFVDVPYPGVPEGIAVNLGYFTQVRDYYIAALPIEGVVKE